LGENKTGKEMKDFLLHYYYIIIDDKIELVSYICLFFWVLIILFWDDISKYIPSGRPRDIWNVWIVVLFCVLMGIVGVTWIIKKKAPIFIIPIRGIPAIILGLFMGLGGFGFAIYGIVINFPLLIGH
jgi:hypothetical protein